MSDLKRLKDYFQHILNNYLKARTSEPFGGHILANILRREVTDFIFNLNFIDGKRYIIHGAPGQGNWAAIPWIAVFDRKITTSAQEGVYVVYLFSEDMSKIYLTLNHGYTKLKDKYGSNEARIRMKESARFIRERLQSDLFSSDNQLDINNVFYKDGTIYYKMYEKDELPEEDILINDLKQILLLYKTYYDKFIFPSSKEDGNHKTNNEEAGEQIIKKGKNETKDVINKIATYIASKGFKYQSKTIENFYLSLKSKPFVILAGTSGTGKSKLVNLFAEAIGATTENGRYLLIPVRPDWSDSTDLLGYKDLHGKFNPGFLTNFIMKAINDIDYPYFLCLDEMNLARVEYYFSDILSIMETKKRVDGKIITDRLLREEMVDNDSSFMNEYIELYIPENLYIVGTVNMDETTFPFSKKVLDRANTIEFSDVDFNIKRDVLDTTKPDVLENKFIKANFIMLKDCLAEQLLLTTISILKEINNGLTKSNLHFGYRIRDEICYYIANNDTYRLLTYDEAMDFQILQKILPRIQGSTAGIKRVLIELFKICINNQNVDFDYNTPGVNEDMLDYLSKDKRITYSKSAEKIAFMMRRFEEDGFTSYWL